MNLRWLHVMIDLPADVDDVASRFWARALGWPLGAPWRGNPEFSSFRPPSGTSFVARQVLESGEPRVHLDIAVDDLDEVSAHMQALGAEPGPVMPRWRVMTSPGGMPYCLVTHAEKDTAPGAMSWSAGAEHRSRLAQICIDSPAALHDDEVAFWQAATHWQWAPASGPEFAGKLRPGPGSPVQLLFQRLDAPAAATRAHIDMGTDDVEAEARRLEALGARRLWDGRGWIALEDPAGLPFCATGNSP